MPYLEEPLSYHRLPSRACGGEKVPARLGVPGLKPWRLSVHPRLTADGSDLCGLARAHMGLPAEGTSRALRAPASRTSSTARHRSTFLGDADLRALVRPQPT